MADSLTRWIRLPLLDSQEMADARRRELRIPRTDASMLGFSAVDAIDAGYYETVSGRQVDWRDEVETARAAKISIAPDVVLPEASGHFYDEMRVQVANETTLQAGKRMTKEGLRPLALNFANGVEPGGGFLGGARAQEEVLCRSSALYATLVGDPMYAHHRKRPRPDSTDWAILSPDVPVFRLDDGTELDSPWLLSFLTCAAPYAPHIGQPESGDLLERRIHRVLAIARAYGYRALVLGAWGCGAFRNDPARTAWDFRSALEAEFAGAFSDIVFAVTDWSDDRHTLSAFAEVFK